MRSVVLVGTMIAAPVVAQAPDPAGVSVPSLSGANDPAVQKNGWKHFFFHKEGVPYAEAYEDFADCYRFLGGARPIGALPLPAFGAWSSVPRVQPAQTTGSYGMVGGLIADMVAGPMNRRLLQSRLRRCLEPRGYVRYPLDEKAWELLVDDYSPRSIAMQAKVASGPRPAAPTVSR